MVWFFVVNVAPRDFSLLCYVRFICSFAVRFIYAKKGKLNIIAYIVQDHVVIILKQVTTC